MGVYIYTLRAKQNSNIHYLGQKITANLLSFAFKSSYWDTPATHKRMLSRAENFWSEREIPKYFVVGDTFENGASLYTGWKGAPGWCYDTPDFPGVHLGYLKKVGRSYKVVPTWKECYSEEELMAMYREGYF